MRPGKLDPTQPNILEESFIVSFVLVTFIITTEVSRQAWHFLSWCARTTPRPRWRGSWCCTMLERPLLSMPGWWTLWLLRKASLSLKRRTQPGQRLAPTTGQYWDYSGYSGHALPELPAGDAGSFLNDAELPHWEDEKKEPSASKSKRTWLKPVSNLQTSRLITMRSKPNCL